MLYVFALLQNSQSSVQPRASAGFRLDRQSVAQLKQELLARAVQKVSMMLKLM